MTNGDSARAYNLRLDSRLCCAVGIFNLFMWYQHSDCVVRLPNDV